MPFGTLVAVAYIEQQKSFARIHAPLPVRDVRLLHALFCVLHKLEKLWRMRHRRLPWKNIQEKRSTAARRAKAARKLWIRRRRRGFLLAALRRQGPHQVH